MDWQPIETAPKHDGSMILAWIPGAGDDDKGMPYVLKWYVGHPDYDTPEWQEAGGEEYWTPVPSHWMPLPEGPSHAR